LWGEDGRSLQAAQVMAWISEVEPRNSEWRNFAAMTPEAAQRALLEGLHVLTVGAQALLLGGADGQRFSAEKLLAVAFCGNDESDLRHRLLARQPELPSLPQGENKITTAWIRKQLVAGAFSQTVETMAICGAEAMQRRGLVSRYAPIGQITGTTYVSPRIRRAAGAVYSGNVTGPTSSAGSSVNACAGAIMEIAFRDMGVEPASHGGVFVRIPTAHDGIFVALPDFAPGTGRWRDSGVVHVTLPPDVTSGWVEFFLVPAGQGGVSRCEAGALSTAAAGFQSALAPLYGGAGVQQGQAVIDVAARVDLFNAVLPQAPLLRTENAVQIKAGKPIIRAFRAVEAGAVHPRGTVTLVWEVVNADTVEIVAEPGAHELPPLRTPLALQERRVVAIPCTRRWSGRYRLTARNSNGCGEAQAYVTLESDFSHYLVGTGRADVTYTGAGIGMVGFADEAQCSRGALLEEGDRLYARAFVIETNTNPARRPLVLVVADIWACTQAVKVAVIQELRSHYERQGNDPNLFDHDNVLIAGTHTHAGPGGYSHYFLYNITIKGFDKNVFDVIVGGITKAITDAYAHRKPGQIFVSKGDLADCGAQRSRAAYDRNANGAGFDAGVDTDREMVLLKFTRYVSANDVSVDVGALNWFAIHPTSLGMRNTRISGDNKGYAERRFESHMARGAADFVAAFGNASAGDVSGNVGPGLSPPMGAHDDTDPAEFERNKARMKQLGDLQFQRAWSLYNDPNATEITEPFAVCYQHVDMSNVTDVATGARLTWPAALGVSFGAGSSEDSVAYVYLDDGAKVGVQSCIIEGMSLVEVGIGFAEFSAKLPLLVAAVSGTASALVGAAILTASSTIAATIGSALPAVLPQAPQLASLITLFSAIATSNSPGTTSVVAAPPAVPAPTLEAALSILDTVLRGLFSPQALSVLAALLGGGIFPERVTRTCAKDAAKKCWRWDLSAGPSLADVNGHAPKPIMFPLGWARLVREDGSASVPCPLVPHVLPLQLIKLGPLAIAGIPAEFTTVAGRRLKNDLNAALGTRFCALAGYANGYAGYVTTPEEYTAQHYEGASTLYGPGTLAAYLQEFGRMAAAINGGSALNPGQPFVPPAVVHRA
jgi:neutral ceramidase